MEFVARNARLVALCIAGCLALSYPLISIFNLPTHVFGLPLLHAYLFGFWALFILVLALAVDRDGTP